MEPQRLWTVTARAQASALELTLAGPLCPKRPSYTAQACSGKDVLPSVLHSLGSWQRGRPPKHQSVLDAKIPEMEKNVFPKALFKEDNPITSGLRGAGNQCVLSVLSGGQFWLSEGSWWGAHPHTSLPSLPSASLLNKRAGTFKDYQLSGVLHY